MKTSKKVLAILLTIATLIGVFSCATPVLATEVTEISETNNKNATTEASETKENAEQSTLDEPEILNEMVEWRTESTKYFRNSDGSYTAAQYGFPVHYKENGEWKEIDNSLTEESVDGNLISSEKEFVAKNTNIPAKFPDEFKKDGSKEIIVNTDGYEISFAPRTSSNLLKKAEGSIKDKNELESTKIVEKFNEKQNEKMLLQKKKVQQKKKV